jgi:hypothetical protein
LLGRYNFWNKSIVDAQHRLRAAERTREQRRQRHSSQAPPSTTAANNDTTSTTNVAAARSVRHRSLHVVIARSLVCIPLRHKQQLHDDQGGKHADDDDDDDAALLLSLERLSLEGKVSGVAARQRITGAAKLNDVSLA